MFRKVYLVLVPLCLVAFQNCSPGSGASDNSSSAGAQSGNYTPLLQDSMTNIDHFEFFHEGGFAGPGVVPLRDLTLTYDQNAQTASASVTVTQTGSAPKTCSMNLTTNDIIHFITNIQAAYLALDGSNAYLADAGDYHFVTHLKNGTSQEYLFVGGDSSHQSIVIFRSGFARSTRQLDHNPQLSDLGGSFSSRNF